MSGKINLTFTVGDTSPARTPGGEVSQYRPPAPGTDPVAAPTLRAVDLFPTRVWQARLEALIPYFDQWVLQVLKMRAASPSPAGRTNRQGWNSKDMAVLEQAEFAPLRSAIRAACESALGEMGVRVADFELQSWINLHDRGGFNFLHLHEGSLLSGSFYLKVPPGSGEFVFRDPRPGVLHSSVKGSGPNGHCDISLTPSVGLLVLFPCWMEHYVESHEADEPRITIAFNANERRGTSSTRRED